MTEVDVRGFSCPIPVVRTQQAIDEHPGQELSVLVDTGVSRENIARLARNKGYDVRVEEVDDDYRLQLIPPVKS